MPYQQKIKDQRHYMKFHLWLRRILPTINKNTRKDVEKNQLSPFEKKATDYSSMSRLLRVTAWTNRFIHNTRTKEKQRGWLAGKELKKAKKQWILRIQFETRKRMINKKSVERQHYQFTWFTTWWRRNQKMSWEIQELYKHARRNKETNIFALNIFT